MGTGVLHSHSPTTSLLKALLTLLCRASVSQVSAHHCRKLRVGITWQPHTKWLICTVISSLGHGKWMHPARMHPAIQDKGAEELRTGCSLSPRLINMGDFADVLSAVGRHSQLWHRLHKQNKFTSGGYLARRNSLYLFELQLPVLIVVKEIENVHLADLYHFHGFFIVIRW